jgi:hypothetical protein
MIAYGPILRLSFYLSIYRTIHRRYFELDVVVIAVIEILNESFMNVRFMNHRFVEAQEVRK